MDIKSFRDLTVWQKAMDLVTDTYALTSVFPSIEQYGLTNQMRRASVSIPSNIAEGNGRRTTRDYLKFLYTARGSLMELQTQVEIAFRLRFVSQERSTEMIDVTASVARLLHGLINSLERKLDGHPPSSH